jgi:hypothetical protein
VRLETLIQQQDGGQVFSSVFVICDAEDTVLSGGFTLNQLNYRPLSVIKNNFDESSNNVWVVILVAPIESNLTGIAPAKCFDNPPLR